MRAVASEVDPRAVGRRTREDVDVPLDVPRAVDDVEAAVAEEIKRAGERPEGSPLFYGEIARAVSGQEVTPQHRGGVGGVGVVEERATRIADKESTLLERVRVARVVEMDVGEANVVDIVWC